MQYFHTLSPITKLTKKISMVSLMRLGILMVVLFFMLFGSTVHAMILHDESVDGDIESNFFFLSNGDNIIRASAGVVGTLGVDDDADADHVDIAVEEGFELASMTARLTDVGTTEGEISVAFDLSGSLIHFGSANLNQIGLVALNGFEDTLTNNLPFALPGGLTSFSVNHSSFYGGFDGEPIDAIFDYELIFRVQPLGTVVPLPAPIVLLFTAMVALVFPKSIFLARWNGQRK